MTPVNRQFYGAENISERLDRIRVANGMTWSDFAVFIGVSRQYVNLLRHGARQPGRRLEQKLVELEGKTDNLLLSVSEEKEHYDAHEALRKCDLLAAENLGLKARLAELDERLKRIEGNGAG